MPSDNLIQTSQGNGDERKATVEGMFRESLDGVRLIIESLRPMINQRKERSIEQMQILNALEKCVNGGKVEYDEIRELKDSARYWWIMLSRRKMQETGVIEPENQVDLSRCLHDLAENMEWMLRAMDDPFDDISVRLMEDWQRHIKWVLDITIPEQLQGLPTR